MWKNKPNGDADLLLAGGFINIAIQYVYNDKPGLRVVATGYRNMIFPDIYNDIADAKKDAETYAKKIFDQFHSELNQMSGVGGR